MKTILSLFFSIGIMLLSAQTTYHQTFRNDGDSVKVFDVKEVKISIQAPEADSGFVRPSYESDRKGVSETFSYEKVSHVFPVINGNLINWRSNVGIAYNNPNKLLLDDSIEQNFYSNYYLTQQKGYKYTYITFDSTRQAFVCSQNTLLGEKEFMWGKLLSFLLITLLLVGLFTEKLTGGCIKFYPMFCFQVAVLMQFVSGMLFLMIYQVDSPRFELPNSFERFVSLGIRIILVSYITYLNMKRRVDKNIALKNAVAT